MNCRQAAWWTGGWAENPAHLPRARDMRMRNQRTTGNGLHLETLFLFYIKTITLLFFNVIAAFTSSAHRRWSTLQTQTNGKDDTEGMMTSHKHQKVPSHFFQSGPTHLRHPSPPRVHARGAIRDTTLFSFRCRSNPRALDARCRM